MRHELQQSQDRLLLAHEEARKWSDTEKRPAGMSRAEVQERLQIALRAAEGAREELRRLRVKPTI